MKTTHMYDRTVLAAVMLLAYLFMTPSVTSGQTGVRKKVTVNGMPVEHLARDLNKAPGDCDNSPFRTLDGTCNNQTSPDRIQWGATDIPLRREIAPDYGSPDHQNDMAGQDRPSPRAISNACVAQISQGESLANLSAFVFTWGQFLDHDIDLTPEGHTEYEPVGLPADEPLFSSDIPFFRSEVHAGTGILNARQQSNLITSWIDASNVYGSDEERADWLRTHQDGKLKTSLGGLLPFNTSDGQYASNIDPDAPSMAGEDGTTKLFVAGDVRANEQVGLTSMHTLFVREHNRICDQLKGQGYTNDEQMYQIARKWVGAYVQSITYREFLPALGIRVHKYNGYNPNVQPDISNIFATAAYRLGHTMVTAEMLLRDDQCQEVGPGSLSLVEAFFSTEPVRQYNIDPFLKGLSVQRQMEVDNYIVDELRNFLFAIPGSSVVFGLDLASLNIQRGRDHGLPDYNAVRAGFQLPPVSSFSQINPDPAVHQALASMYNDVNDIDAWVGLLAEPHLNGKSVGATLDRILVNQFERLRDGDFFYYENDSWFNPQEKDQIRNTRLSDIIRRNSALIHLEGNVFKVQDCKPQPGPGGPGGGHHSPDLNTPGISNPELANGSATGLSVFPNPTSGIIRIDLNLTGATKGHLILLNANGKTIIQEEVTIMQGLMQKEMDLGTFTPGLYILQVITDAGTFSDRVVLENR